jgi:hypothetical protein
MIPDEGDDKSDEEEVVSNTNANALFAQDDRKAAFKVDEQEELMTEGL